jgi:D-3-phosphoglycerate dehydrogenase / 2-oxoglutarate reductase
MDSQIMSKVLVSDPIDQAGIDILSQVAKVDVKTGLKPDELIKIIGEYDAIMIRSETRITKEIIEAATNLKIIGRAGVGVDNVDVPFATRKGIVVVNSPEGNTIAAAEHALAMMLSLARYIPVANQSMKAGEWNRKLFVGTEVYKKTLGIVGLGKIGSHVANVAKAMGMNLLAYDPFISAERAEEIGCTLVELDILFRESDYITLHIPKTPETANLIDAESIGKMRPTARIINCARGGIIDEVALAGAIESGKIAGAAIDVYAVEPLGDSPLRAVGSNLVLTPHLGASTAEAQINVALDVAEQIRDVLLGLPARSAVNIPSLRPEDMEYLKPYLQLAETLGGMIGQLAGGRIDHLDVFFYGDLAEQKTKLIVTAALKGLLSNALQERINYVNAGVEAKERGINVVEIRDPSQRDYSGSMRLSAKGTLGLRSVNGVLLSHKEIRITSVDDFPVSVLPTRHMLITLHKDVPGIIGSIGSVLGRYNINIASMQVGRKMLHDNAMMILNLDDPLPDNVRSEIKSIVNIHNAHTIVL